MDDALSRLTRAIARIGEELRARRKKKRPQRPSGPRPSGPNANKGCGTGAGGFGAGNSCAKEDGRPNAPTSPVMRPVNAKADMAKAKAMKEKAAKKQAAKIAADKARAEAYRPIKEAKAAAKSKQKRIEKLRKAAAERKAAKGERDAAEMKAAAEAAAAKRAAMLQKIRVKKANEQIKIVEKPPSVFSGAASNVAKSAGETEVEFQIRRHKHDLDKLHSEADKIDSHYADRVSATHKELDLLNAARNDHSRDSVMFNSRNSEWHEKNNKIWDAIAKKREELDSLAGERDGRIHDLVGEFTVAYSGGTARVSTNPSDYKFETKPGVSGQDIAGAKESLKGVWGWLSRVASPKHEATIARQKLIFRSGGGGSHNGRDEEVTIGIQAKSTLRKTGVHEYGHAMENADARTMRALDEDFTKRAEAFMSQEKGARIMGLDGVSYYECVYKAGEKRQDLVGEALYAPSHLGYARRYSDCGYDQATRQEHKNDPRFGRGTEVFSTGIESVYREPSQFRKRARHGFDLSILIIAGRL